MPAPVRPSAQGLHDVLPGGPGCSSELAVFFENGPCNVNAQGTGTVPNPYGWNAKANLIYIDQVRLCASMGTHDLQWPGRSLGWHVAPAAACGGWLFVW
jgi:hypothetical protein